MLNPLTASAEDIAKSVKQPTAITLHQGTKIFTCLLGSGVKPQPINIDKDKI